MREGWEKSEVREFAKVNSVPFSVDASTLYKSLGVKWYAQGVFARDEKPGSAIKGKILYRVQTGQFIYNRMFATEGSFALVQQEQADGVVSNEFPVFDIDREKALPEFLYLHFQQPSVWEAVAKECVGTTKSRSRWKEERFLSYEIMLPPLAEQQRIVDLIGALDEAIEAANENAAHAINARFALAARSFALMSAGRTVPLSEIAETRLGKMLSANVNKGTPAKYVRNADVQWNSINLTGLKSMPFSDGDRDEYSIKRGDVLICEGGEIGRSSVVLDDLDNIYFQKAIHRVRCGETLIPEFLQAYMHHLAFSGGLENFSGGTTIPHLTGVNLRQLPMPVVPIADQRALVTILDALNSNSSSLVAYAASLRNLRTNLLTALLSGAHEIPESYDDQLAEAV